MLNRSINSEISKIGSKSGEIAQNRDFTPDFTRLSQNKKGVPLFSSSPRVKQWPANLLTIIVHTVTHKCTTRQHHLSLSFFNLSHFTIHSFTQYRTGTNRNPQVTKSLLSFSQPSKFQQIASQNRNNHLFPRPP